MASRMELDAAVRAFASVDAICAGKYNEIYKESVWNPLVF
jgi:hypothetical protein